MSDSTPLFKTDGRSIRFWVHHALEAWPYLATLIAAYGGTIPDIMGGDEAPEYALVSNSPNFPVSARKLSELMESGCVIVQPAWLLDSIQNGSLLDEGPYLSGDRGAGAGAGDSKAPSQVFFSPLEDGEVQDPAEVEKSCEAAEFLLRMVSVMYKKEFDEVYDACSAQHPSRSFWETFNAPGTQLHTIAVSLRTQLQELDRDDKPLMSTDIFERARRAFPALSSVPTPAPKKSALPSIRPPSSRSSSSQLSEDDIETVKEKPPKGNRAGQPYSKEEEAMVARIIEEEHEKADFRPGSTKWWVDKTHLFDGRSARGLQDHYYTHFAPKTPRVRVAPSDSGTYVARQSAQRSQLVTRNLYQVTTRASRKSSPRKASKESPRGKTNKLAHGGRFTDAETTQFMKILNGERQKWDFNPTSATWWLPFAKEFPQRDADALARKVTREQDDKKLAHLGLTNRLFHALPRSLADANANRPPSISGSEYSESESEAEGPFDSKPPSKPVAGEAAAESSVKLESDTEEERLMALLTGPARRAGQVAFSRKEVERLLNAYGPSENTLSHSDISRLAARSTRSLSSWRHKAASYSKEINALLSIRRRRAGHPLSVAHPNDPNAIPTQDPTPRSTRQSRLKITPPSTAITTKKRKASEDGPRDSIEPPAKRTRHASPDLSTPDSKAQRDGHHTTASYSARAGHDVDPVPPSSSVRQPISPDPSRNSTPRVEKPVYPAIPVISNDKSSLFQAMVVWWMSAVRAYAPTKGDSERYMEIWTEIAAATKQSIGELIATFYLNLESFQQLQDKMTALA